MARPTPNSDWAAPWRPTAACRGSGHFGRVD
jgi:hypothetical protein